MELKGSPPKPLNTTFDNNSEKRARNSGSLRIGLKPFFISSSPKKTIPMPINIMEI